MAAFLAPIIASLVANGMGTLAQAVVNKGQDFVEEKLGVKLDDFVQTDEGKIKLKQLELDHEEMLLKWATENRKVDMDYYKIDAEDRDSARKREVAIANTDSSWLAKNIVPVLALTIVIGGGCGIVWSPDTDVRLGLTAIVTAVVTYYFGTSKGSDRKDTAIQNLSAVKE